MTIKIKSSPTADTRTCDYKTVTQEMLMKSSTSHIVDVAKGMMWLSGRLGFVAGEHDFDKLSDIEGFHRDFATNFDVTTWWDNHRKISRHHLADVDDEPDNVNLLDVLEYIVDCVMAGMARTGEVTPVNIPPEVLRRAFENTVELLIDQVEVED